LQSAGALAESVVESVVVKDEALAGFAELQALRAGLDSLSARWSARRKRD
jgi:hypothetical protein